MRELQKQSGMVAPKTSSPKLLDGQQSPSSSSNGDTRIAVRVIHISGNSIFAASELDALIANLIGKEVTLAELDEGAGRISAHYQERGYIVARAYLPAQEIKDGVIVISVAEGYVGAQRLSNRSRLSDVYVHEYLSGIRSGEAIQVKPVDRAILLLSDTPGVGGVRAALQPGASVGTSDLIIELDRDAAYAAGVDLDNFGNHYTGEYRLSTSLALNSPLQMGDQLGLRALISDQNLSYARLAYQLPIGGGGLQLGAAYSDTRYRLGREFSGLLAHGNASSSSLFAAYPFVRSINSNFSGILILEDKILSDQTDAPITSMDKRVRLTSLGVKGNHQDSLGGAGITSFDFSWVAGSLGMDAATSASDALSARSSGAFMRQTFNLNRLQRLTESNMLSITVSGQLANKNLNSSEEFSLGGVSGVRAYPQGEGSGDEGWLASLELRRNVMPGVQGVMFYETGSVRVNREQFILDAPNTRTLAGAGVGLNAHLAGAQFRAYLAWRVRGGLAVSEPSTINRNPRLWLQAGKQF